jgi:hypothetical protein
MEIVHGIIDMLDNNLHNEVMDKKAFKKVVKELKKMSKDSGITVFPMVKLEHKE